MKFKLYNDNPQENIAQVLINRGVKPGDLENWINAYNHCRYPYWFLDNIDEACYRMEKAVRTKENVLVVVDCDADGYTSAAMFINYFYNIEPTYTENYIDFILHSGKQHGLNDIEIDEDKYSLIIAPDSSSNDYDKHQYYNSIGIDIIILDHHEAEQISPWNNVITVNNQLCNYPNKAFSGAGIVLHFCEAYDDKYGYNCADLFLDLCAVGNASDMMDFTSLETRAVIVKGLKELRNPFLKYLAETNNFTMEKRGGNTYMGCAFGISPFINAINRSARMDEKEQVFKAMLEQYAYNEVPNTIRGHKGEMTILAKEAVHICTSVKRRQTQAQDETMEFLEKKIQENNLLDNAALICLCEPGEVEPNIAGLAANKLMSKYQRPCFVLTKSIGENKEELYQGSARNYSMSEIEDLRQVCDNSNITNFAQGHSSAFGTSINADKIKDFNDYLNDVYKTVAKEPVYWVDYLWNMNNTNNDLILNIGQHLDCWGTGCPEPFVGIKDINLEECNIVLMGQKKNTIKITLPNGLPLIQFGVNEEVFDEYTLPHRVLTIVGKCNANKYNGNVTPQIIIEDSVLREEWVF